MTIALYVAVIGVGILVLAELGLRWGFGFGNPLIYRADDEIGYLLAPNQAVRRFGNRIQINQYSMRSPAVQPNRPDAALRLLLLGDSIANGGWWTDQDQTVSALLQARLQSLPASFRQVEVLNASANSWGPRNELAYVKQFGSFEAQVTVLLINTDDLFATAPYSVVVGRSKNYPARKPPLALVEVLNRYFLPAPSIPEMAEINAEGGDRVGFNLEAIQQTQALVQGQGGKFMLVMTPLLRELGEPGPRDYEIKARQRLTEFAQAHQIPYVDFLAIFNAVSEPKTLYRDHIHLSEAGNELVSDRITAQVQQLLPAQKSE